MGSLSPKEQPPSNAIPRPASATLPARSAAPFPPGPVHMRQCAPAACTWRQPGGRPWASILHAATHPVKPHLNKTLMACMVAMTATYLVQFADLQCCQGVQRVGLSRALQQARLIVEDPLHTWWCCLYEAAAIDEALVGLHSAAAVTGQGLTLGTQHLAHNHAKAYHSTAQHTAVEGQLLTRQLMTMCQQVQSSHGQCISNSLLAAAHTC